MALVNAIKQVHLCESASGRFVVIRHVWEKDEDPGFQIIGGPRTDGHASLGRQREGDIRVLAERTVVYNEAEPALKALRIALRKAADALIPGPREALVGLTTEDAVLPWARRWSLTHRGRGWIAVEALYQGGDRGEIRAEAFVSAEDAVAWVEQRLAGVATFTRLARESSTRG